jgi:predicted GNAT family N-acyltransferase
MQHPHLFTIANSPLKIKMVTTAYEGMTVAYIRYKVFIEEQKIDVDEEFDGTDMTAVSFLLFLDHVPIGTMRYLKDEQGHIHPGRIAILKAYRNKGYGRKLMAWFDTYIVGLYRHVTIKIHAQRYLQTFYENLGYQAYGQPFIEAKIEHIAMQKTLTRPTL